MPLPEPVFDSRKYRDILEEVVRRIPIHNPEWNNYSDSDPGITLLQLFAFMSESLLYRANRIPERNREKFLRLLRIGIRSPQPARGMITILNPKGRLAVATLGPEQEVRAGKVPFRTLNGLDVLPVESALFYKSRLPADRRTSVDALYRQLYASYGTPGGALDYYQTQTFEPPAAGAILESLDVGTEAVDGLWLALFARKGDDVTAARRAIGGATLTLGFLPALDEAGVTLPPEGTRRLETQPALVFELPNVTPSGEAAYRRLTPRTKGNPLLEPALVELSLPDADALATWTNLDPLEAGVGDYPPDLADDARLAQLVTWIRIRLPRETLAGGQVSFRVSWLGINAAEVVQMARTPAELLPAGTGEPDQSAVLANTPVLVDTVRLTVNGSVWTRIDDLYSAGPEVPTRAPRLATARTQPAGSCGASPTTTAAPEQASAAVPPTRVYVVDRESGEVRFGDGAHGTRPPQSAVIQASYSWGGGREGTVGIGVIKGSLPPDLKYFNPIPTWGGDPGETVADAERRIPQHLHHRDRLVAPKDFIDLTWSTPGVALGRVEALPLFHPEQPGQSSAGVVTVLVVPATDPRNPRAPQPDRLFLQTICEYLAPRRLVTTELHVNGPEYVDVWVSIGIDVVAGRDQGPVRDAVRSQTERFLSPLTGGFDGAGWPLDRAVDAGEIAAAAARVTGVAKVTGVLLGDSAGSRPTPIAISGLQLPRLVALSVVSAEPTPIAELQGQAPPATTPTMTPVPVVPETC